MSKIQFKAKIILMVLPLMSLNSGKKIYSELDLLDIGNAKLKKELKLKEEKRQNMEDQLSFHDSLTRIKQLQCKN